MRIPSVVLLVLFAAPVFAQSIYTTRPQDLLAVVADASAGLHGDGVADDTDAFQSAIDRAAETTGQGIVFLPSGRYRISKTVYLWSGIRLIGYGRQRPLIMLAPNTPGLPERPRVSRHRSVHGAVCFP